ncbi:hypothetical protein EIP86_003876 [Pleurotus ostreatoroseus]|nr:hypothetical protein EIP86_003876 [Pleurotus ostreatoroseus]
MVKSTSGGLVSLSPKKGAPIVTSLRSSDGSSVKFNRFAARQHHATKKRPIAGITAKLAAAKDRAQPAVDQHPQQESYVAPPVREGVLETVQEDVVTEKVKPKVNNTVKMSERSHKFLGVSAEAFSAFLEHERVPRKKKCEACSMATECVYRCTDCLQPPVACKTCTLKKHERLPFHILAKYDGVQRFWVECSLDDLGASIYLGHGGVPCPYILDARSMTVVHERGIYTAHIYFCGCCSLEEPPTSDVVQLIRAGLWPASWAQPRTAFSMSLMHQFHLLSVHAHVNPYDYFNYLARRTDDTFPGDCEDRYREMNTAIREYEFFVLCKRHGVEPEAEMKPRSLVTLCPACPQIDINMEPTWKDRPEALRYLDALFHTIDGNFVSNQKDKKRDLEDFPLTTGAGYFVDERDAKVLLDNQGPLVIEHSTCNNFEAMNHMRHWGAVSGTIGISCARHENVLGGGGMDLQKGERFINVDLALLSALQPYMELLRLVRAYDIVCQHAINLKVRAAELAKLMPQFRSILKMVPEAMEILMAIGKFHMEAHGPDCRYRYSFRYLPGVGMTDGEAQERVWSGQNGIALRTREQASGHRHDTINYFHDDRNYQKANALSGQLTRKLKAALKMKEQANDHLTIIEKEVKTGPLGEATLDEWKKWEKEWTARAAKQRHGKSKAVLEQEPQSPYEVKEEARLTKSQMLSDLLKTTSTSGTTTTGLLSAIEAGIELQETQARLLVELGEHGTASKKDEKEMVKTFKHQVEQWRSRETMYLQPLYEAAAGVLDATQRREAAINMSIESPEDAVQDWEPPEEWTADPDDDNTSKKRKRKEKKKRKEKETVKEKEKEKRPATSQASSPSTGSQERSEEWTEVNAIQIQLPSSQNPSIQMHEGMRIARGIEEVLRKDQGRTELDNVRAQLITSFGVSQVKKAVSGQGRKTRAQAAVKRKWKAVHSAANAYRRARAALIALGTSTDDIEFRPLTREDLKPFKMYGTDEELQAARSNLGESRKKVSWLWERWSFIEATTDPKLHASTQRWEEEVCLLKEEMRRSVRFYIYSKRWWQCQADEHEAKGRLGHAGASWK